MSWAYSDWPAWLQNLIWTGVVVASAFVIWFVLHRFIRGWIRSRIGKMYDQDDLAQRARAQRFQTIASVLDTIVVLILVTGAIVYIMAVWGIPITPLVAGLGAVGVAIGFGAQDFVKDVIAGFFVLVEDQYAIGDVVDIAGVTGAVEEIRLRTTVLRSLDGAVHHVPNGDVRVASNLTPDFSRIVVDIGVSYDADVDAAIAAIGDEAEKFFDDEKWSTAHTEEPVVLGVDELGDSAVVIRTLFTTDPDRRWEVKREFLRRVKYRLDAEGIDIAYPHLQIVQEGGSAFDRRPEG
jgi:moderate conductance mechanosensitive channel